MPPPKSCGPHTELASNNMLKVTRCSCGTMHVTLLRSGVTVRMSADALRGVASGLKSALEKIDEEPPHLGSTIIN
jgi:hypothetical protein